ncbi:hypothetical protein ACJX0J_015676, partial [Zea mays]
EVDMLIMFYSVAHNNKGLYWFKFNLLTDMYPSLIFEKDEGSTLPFQRDFGIYRLNMHSELVLLDLGTKKIVCTLISPILATKVQGMLRCMYGYLLNEEKQSQKEVAVAVCSSTVIRLIH